MFALTLRRRCLLLHFDAPAAARAENTSKQEVFVFAGGIRRVYNLCVRLLRQKNGNYYGCVWIGIEAAFCTRGLQ